MKKPKNLGFEPVHPKNVLLASVVHGISCLFENYFHSLKGFFYTRNNPLCWIVVGWSENQFDEKLHSE
jgi:hypothetical protein